MQLAGTLLTRTSKSIAEIADDVGTSRNRHSARVKDTMGWAGRVQARSGFVSRSNRLNQAMKLSSISSSRVADPQRRVRWSRSGSPVLGWRKTSSTPWLSVTIPRCRQIAPFESELVRPFGCGPTGFSWNRPSCRVIAEWVAISSRNCQAGSRWRRRSRRGHARFEWRGCEGQEGGFARWRWMGGFAAVQWAYWLIFYYLDADPGRVPFPIPLLRPSLLPATHIKGLLPVDVSCL